MLWGIARQRHAFSPHLALPGFHIFDYHAIPTADVASIHFDLQYQLIDWSDDGPAPDFTQPISFTLPARLPAGGGPRRRQRLMGKI